MVFLGLLVTFAGFLIAMLSVGIASSLGVRLVLVVVGLALNLVGIIGMINPTYMKNAIWKK